MSRAAAAGNARLLGTTGLTNVTGRSAAALLTLSATPAGARPFSTNHPAVPLTIKLTLAAVNGRHART